MNIKEKITKVLPYSNKPKTVIHILFVDSFAIHQSKREDPITGFL